MAKNTRSPRRLPTLAENLNVVSLGVCKDLRCADYYPGIPHRHALTAIGGIASPAEIRYAEGVLRRLGFVGELEVTYTTRSDYLRSPLDFL